MGYISALRVEHKAQKIRKTGKPACVAVNLIIPVYQMSTGLLNTVEGSVLCNRLTIEQYNAVNAKYKDVDEITRHAVMFAAKPGEYLDRAAWWRQLLREALKPDEATTAMIVLLRWYRRCKEADRA